VPNEQRFIQFVDGHGDLQEMALFLVMGATGTLAEGCSDDALAKLRRDAEDLRAAANKWADACLALAETWRSELADQAAVREEHRHG
jgi:hypothetical protein